MLKAEEITESENIVSFIVDDLLTLILEKQMQGDSSLVAESAIFNQKQFNVYSHISIQCQQPVEQIFFENNVAVTERNLIEICTNTVFQGNNEKWHSERAIRISASRAHSIKSRPNKFDQLSSTFLEPKSIKGRALTNFEYGNKNEENARQLFEKLSGLKVLRCGLVIHLTQPWLCASPDGIIWDGNIAKVLEIKCPISLRYSPLLQDDGEIKVPYLKRDGNGRIHLKETHQYYTQCQILLYCTGLNICTFLIYSEKYDSLIIEIPRDEEFLQSVVPKLEWFYFTYLLNRLISKFGI